MKRLFIAVVVIAPLALAAGWILFYSPWLSVSRIEVTIGAAPDIAGALGSDEVLAVAQVESGTPLMRVSTGEVEDRIAALPQVASVSVTRAWPDVVVIDIVRRQPVASVAQSDGYEVVDSSGAVIRRVSSPAEGVPVVRATGEGLPAAIAVAQDLPADLRGRVMTVEASTRHDVQLVLRDSTRVMWGSADEAVFKAEVLQSLFQVGARWYDVSSPGVPATSNNPRPTPAPSTAGSPAS